MNVRGMYTMLVPTTMDDVIFCMSGVYRCHLFVKGSVLKNWSGRYGPYVVYDTRARERPWG